MSLRIDELGEESIEDAVAYWLFSEDEGWERWRLVPGSAAVSPNGQVLRLTFELEDETFQLALVQRGDDLFVKYDDHDEPERELPARVFTAPDEALVCFVHKDQTVFVHLELDV